MPGGDGDRSPRESHRQKFLQISPVERTFDILNGEISLRPRLVIEVVSIIGVVDDIPRFVEVSDSAVNFGEIETSFAITDRTWSEQTKMECVRSQLLFEPRQDVCVVAVQLS